MCGYIFLFCKPLRLIVLFSDGTDFQSWPSMCYITVKIYLLIQLKIYCSGDESQPTNTFVIFTNKMCCFLTKDKLLSSQLRLVSIAFTLCM